jgi:hypothetical protein
MDVHRFFLFKIGRLSSKTSIDVKTDAPDSVDFATTLLLLPRLWQLEPSNTVNCQSHGKWTAGLRQYAQKLDGECLQFAQ